MIKLPRTADYFLTVPAFEVVALKRYLELMERNLATLIDQDIPPEWDGRPETNGPTFVAQLHHDVVNGILPQLFRSSFVIATYSVYVAALAETAKVLRSQHGIEPELIGTQNFLSDARRYFASHFGIPVFTEATNRERIIILKRVRDAIVHANGREGALPEKKWVGLERDRVRFGGFTLNDGYIRLEPEFLVDSLTAVTDSLRAVLAKAQDSLEEAAKAPNAVDRPPLNLGGVN